MGRWTSFARRLGCHAVAITAMANAASCGIQPSAKEAAFVMQFPAEDVNESIVLEIVEESGSLIVKNRTETPVIFHPVTDVKGLVFNERTGQWDEVENEVEFPPNRRPNLVLPRGSVSNIEFVDFVPKELPPGGDGVVRVVVVGRFWKKNEVVGDPILAFLDLTLKP